MVKLTFLNKTSCVLVNLRPSFLKLIRYWDIKPFLVVTNWERVPLKYNCNEEVNENQNNKDPKWKKNNHRGQWVATTDCLTSLVVVFIGWIFYTVEGNRFFKTYGITYFKEIVTSVNHKETNCCILNWHEVQVVLHDSVEFYSCKVIHSKNWVHKEEEKEKATNI